MKWILPENEKYYIKSNPPGFSIALYYCQDGRHLVAWHGNREIAQRRGILTMEAHQQAMAELKAICEELATSRSSP